MLRHPSAHVRRRMRLRGAWLYVHPENEQAALRRLAEL
jgi:hypothetical protein